MRRLLCLTLLCLTPVMVSASNAGIVRGLWFDREAIFADTPTRIYVAIRNNTGADLHGTVEFFINDTRIARNNLDALDGRIVESWADWTPRYGTSTISVTLSRTELSSSASGTRAVRVSSPVAAETIFIDRDTDRDSIGDSLDPDDDNDGVSDRDEIAAGTDPLVADTASVDDTLETETADETADTATEDSQEDTPAAAGLEQFLTPSRAHTILTTITNVAQEQKAKLDSYRATRAENATPPAPEMVPVNEDGFGAIERLSKEDSSRPQAEKPSGFLGDVFTAVGNIASAVYGGLLAALSSLLGNPILLQLALLLGLPAALILTARKLANRRRA